MNPRTWKLMGVSAALAVVYAVFFTDWIKPEPIEIASQIRMSVLQPRFGRPTNVQRAGTNGNMMVVKELKTTKTPEGVVTNVVLRTNAAVKVDAKAIKLPQWGTIEQAPGGVANVTFSLDSNYVLTALKVVDVPKDGSQPKVLWALKGKSLPTHMILYGRDPEGMSPINTGSKALPLEPGVPYQLLLEAGRRRGVHAFSTRPNPGA